MARIALNPPRTLLNRLVDRICERVYGQRLDPARVMGHQPQVLRGYLVFEGFVSRMNVLDPRLRSMAFMATAHVIGCSWCSDFGYWAAHTEGIDQQTLRELPHWRDSDRFSELDRLVLSYVEAMTATPDEVTDEMVAELDARLGTPALVELTAAVAVENQRSRFNAAFGLTSQGFKDRCELVAA